MLLDLETRNNANKDKYDWKKGQSTKIEITSNIGLAVLGLKWNFFGVNALVLEFARNSVKIVNLEGG